MVILQCLGESNICKTFKAFVPKNSNSLHEKALPGESDVVLTVKVLTCSETLVSREISYYDTYSQSEIAQS